MPVKSQALLSSASDAIPSATSTRRDANKIENDNVEKIALINNGYDVLNILAKNISWKEKKNYVYQYFINYFSRNKNDSKQNDIELDNILAQGKVLQQDSEYIAEQLQHSGKVHPPAFSLKTKLGLAIGSALVLIGSGVGLYVRRGPMNDNAKESSSDNVLYSKKEFSKNHLKMESEQFLNTYVNTELQSFSQARKIIKNTDESDVKALNSTADRAEGQHDTSTIKNIDNKDIRKEKLTINKCKNDASAFQRYRNRLIGYIHSYVSLPKDAEDKEIAQLLLSLIAKHSFHEANIAQIYLYGSGLYGEKKDEYLSSNIQRLLVGDLLSKLLYEQSIDEYLIDFFAVNRYISIKDFKEKIMKDNFPFENGISLDEMRFFHEKYIIPFMPILSMELSGYSQILVGSVTWLFIYLSSASEWLDSIKYDEMSAIVHGIDILNYFSNGTLSQVSEKQVEMGLKFCALYINPTQQPEHLTDFNSLWNVFRGELLKKIKLSSEMVMSIRKITSAAKGIKYEKWYSKLEFAEEILMQYCGTKSPDIYFEHDGKRKYINKKEFIKSTAEHGWCVIPHHEVKGNWYDNLQIKIPTIQPLYKNLINNALMLIKNTYEVLLTSAFTQSDYFNPEQLFDDILFIEKSALQVVSLKITEHRYIQEQRIGPPLKKISSKDGYLFFQASYQGETRVYAIDKGYKKPIVRVHVDTKKIKEDLRVFFNDWSNYPDNLLKVHVYEDEKMKISISEQQPTLLFIEKLSHYQVMKVRDEVRKHNESYLSLEETILNVLKDLLIPFHSCVATLQGDDATEAFVSCFLDMLLLVGPAAAKIFTTAKQFSERTIDIGFMINKNRTFNNNGSILWGRIIRDITIYNTILNEQSMLRSSVIKLFISSFDPGVGIVMEIKRLASKVAFTVIKGELIRLPIALIRHAPTVAEFSVRMKSILESSKKITVKITKPSGRLTGGSYFDNSTSSTFSPSLYGTAYQFGDYYAYHSNKNEIDVLLGITEETTDSGENIYVMLSEDEFKGFVFRCTFDENAQEGSKITPWISPEFSAEKIISLDYRDTKNGREILFKMNVNTPANYLVIYPGYRCLLSEDGVSHDKRFNIFKINNVHYVFDPETKTLRPLYDGDMTEIKKSYENETLYNLRQDTKGNLLIRNATLNDTQTSLFNRNYALSNNSPLTRGISVRNENRLYLLSNRLFVSKQGNYFELDMQSIKNKFMISNYKYKEPSFTIGWDSLNNDFIPAKPYLKKSSSHVGISLEDIVNENCAYSDKLMKFPTLLLSGAVLSVFDFKLRIMNYYYLLESLGDDFFYLKCNGPRDELSYKLYYDMFTESFELAADEQSNTSLKNNTLSPYDDLISQSYSIEKFPEMMEIINLNSDVITNELTMRLRQAAFMKRLNPIERMETLQLPLVQLYSWELHRDAQLFQRKHPVAALWMTWQRQLYSLFRQSLPEKLPLIERIYLTENSGNKNISCNGGFLINSKYSFYEAIWVSYNAKEKPSSFHRVEGNFYSEVLEAEESVIEWFPKANILPGHSSVTQFMYEKDVHPRINIDIKSQYAIIIDSRFGPIKIERYTSTSELEYFIISPNCKWLVSIDSQRAVLFYNLLEDSFLRAKNSEIIIYAKIYSKLNDPVHGDYSLFVLSDDGVLYCPKDNLWIENNGNKALWAPPIDYFPAFVSLDQRFLGFSHKDHSDVILYDQKRKLATLLRRPLAEPDNINVTAVAFSALNAVIALAFSDGYVYLYDLIRERQSTMLEHIAYIRLDNTTNSDTRNNIIMRFNGVFNSLNIIHPGVALNTSQQRDDEIYILSSYSFSNTKVYPQQTGQTEERHRTIISPEEESSRSSISSEEDGSHSSISPEKGSSHSSISPEEDGSRSSISPEEGSSHSTISPEEGSSQIGISPEEGRRRNIISPEDDSYRPYNFGMGR